MTGGRSVPRPPIEVRRHGREGREVVLLHGGPGAPGSVASLARAIEHRFRVLEPLQRRAGEVPLDVARHVEDLAAVVPDPALLVGWAWGAMLALSFAAEHPGRVAGIALVGCGTYDPSSRAAFVAATDERLGPQGRARKAWLEDRLASGTDPGAHQSLFEELAHLYTRAQSFDPLPDPGGDLPVDRSGHEETWRDVLARQASGREPASFAAIRCPILMLHGDRDPHPGRSTCETLRRHVPRLEYAELSECGHAPWLERRACTPFLARLSAWLDAAPARAPVVPPAARSGRPRGG